MSSSLFSEVEPVVKQRGVHLDFKGLVPTFEHLERLLILFKKMGYTTLLVEWEDAFPWSIHPGLQGPYAFTRNEIRRFADSCAELDLEIIPLVQSLGHSENVLHLKDFAKLRELPNRTDVFHPLHPESPQIVKRMVEDVLQLLPEVKRFHLGGDEVYTLGQHPDSRAFVEQNGLPALWMQQLDPTIRVLNSKGIRPLVWHDEIVKWEEKSIHEISQKLDLVVWGYTGDPRDHDTYHHRFPHIEKLHQAGCTLWGASAYKGADGPSANLPDSLARAKATLGWAELSSSHNLEGIFMTGWSRYAYGRIQVTPLDAALDSLVYAAAILTRGSSPEGGLEACVAWLDDQGHGEHLRQYKNVLERLTKHVEQSWEWIRQLEDQVANVSMEPKRAHSGIECIIFELLEEDIRKANEAGDDLQLCMAGNVKAPLPFYYRESRIRPLLACAKRLKEQFDSKRPLTKSEADRNEISDSFRTPKNQLKSDTTKNTTTSKGFTLIELLVVLAILGLLVTLIVPAITSALKSARTVACASNLRQISMASIQFSASKKGKLLDEPFTIPDVYWFRQIYPFIKSNDENKTTAIFQCAEDKEAIKAFHSGESEWDSISYLLIIADPSWKFLSQITNPSVSPQFIDAEITATRDYRTPVKFEQKVKGSSSEWRHGKGINVANWDGSVRSIVDPSYQNLIEASL